MGRGEGGAGDDVGRHCGGEERIVSKKEGREGWEGSALEKDS